MLSSMIRAREAGMLTRERMDRMLSAPSFQEAAKLLTDCGYEDMSGCDAAGVDAALSRIKAKVLAIPCRRDILHPADFVQWAVDRITWLGGQAECYPIDSDYGHMAGILQTHLFDEKVRRFLA